MVSTRKVAVLTASIIAVDCTLAGVAAAQIIGGAPDTMSEIAAIGWTLVAGLAALNFILVKIILNEWRKRESTGEDILAESLDKSTDAKALLTAIAAKITRHDEALGPLLEDLHLRKAADKAGELPPLK